MFNGYSWQTRILEVRPDRLPPEYDINHPLASPFTVNPNLPQRVPSTFGITGGGYSTTAPYEILPTDIAGAGIAIPVAVPQSVAMTGMPGPSSPTQQSLYGPIPPIPITSQSRSGSRIGMHSAAGIQQPVQGRTLFVGNVSVIRQAGVDSSHRICYIISCLSNASGKI